jgi:hypothetical protein
LAFAARGKGRLSSGMLIVDAGLPCMNERLRTLPPSLKEALLARAPYFPATLRMP